LLYSDKSCNLVSCSKPSRAVMRLNDKSSHVRLVCSRTHAAHHHQFTACMEA
jgi:hypothetical protein